MSWWEKLISNLGSKKFLAFIAGFFGLEGIEIDSETKAWGLVILAGSYLISQGFADGLSKKYASKPENPS